MKIAHTIGCCLMIGLLVAQHTMAQQPGPWKPDRAGGELAPTRITQQNGFQEKKFDGKLDTSFGQVWREYDIRSFTHRLRDQEKPEQPIVDWILRETGTSTWFGDVQSVLSAEEDRVLVYHTPEVQNVVERTIDRFLDARADANEVAVRLVTVNKADWRIRAQPVLTPVKTQTPGIEAWLISRENAALLMHELSQRNDFREHNSPNLTIHSGQTHKLEATRPRVFSTGFNPASVYATPGTNHIDEGFRLEISPLVTQDGESIEAVIKCAVNQVEKLSSVRSTGVDQFGLVRNSRVQVPQISSWQLHERFRWPKNEVLLISRGLVATPERTTKWNEPIRRMVENGGQRGNALLFLESRSEVHSTTRSIRTAAQTESANYRGRY